MPPAHPLSTLSCPRALPPKSTVCLVPRLGVALGILVRRLMDREEGVDKTSVPVGTHVHASSIHVLRGTAVHERTLCV